MKFSIGNIDIRCLQGRVEEQTEAEACLFFISEGEDVNLRSPDDIDLREGQAVVREAEPGRYSIFARPPSTAEEGMAKEIFKCCFANAFALCERNGIQSIALPLTKGTEACWPLDVAATAATEALVEIAQAKGPLKHACFAVESAAEYNTLPQYLIRGAATAEVSPSRFNQS